MKRVDTKLSGVCIIEPDVLSDPRGFFMETYHERKFRDLGITARFVQDNHSKSVRGTLRGLHFQVAYPQAKLCRVTNGEVLDVAVDVRRGSPSFGDWVAVVLSAENKRQLFVPRGFAHGFLVVSETAEFLYKCDDFYYPADERAVSAEDPAIGVEWNDDGQRILSRRDSLAPVLASLMPDDLPGYEAD